MVALCLAMDKHLPAKHICIYIYQFFQKIKKVIQDYFEECRVTRHKPENNTHLCRHLDGYLNKLCNMQRYICIRMSDKVNSFTN